MQGKPVRMRDLLGRARSPARMLSAQLPGLLWIQLGWIVVGAYARDRLHLVEARSSMERALDAMASFTARTAASGPTGPPSASHAGTAAASGAPPSEAAAAVAGYVFPARVSQAVVTAARLVEQVFVFAFALFFR